MARPSRFAEHQYLGDKRSLVVHDLDETVDECAIDELMASERFLGFGPDTLAEARNRGYRPCRHCIKAVRRRQAAAGDGGEGGETEAA